jgi:uncharacterized membrane protein
MIQFAIALPWWALVLVGLAAVAAAWATYAGAIVPLTRPRRASLVSLRALTLLLLAACLLRPVRVVPSGGHDAVVPVLVDVSRSMRVRDADGRSRIDAARELVTKRIVPLLSARFTPDVWTFGDALHQADAVRTHSADAGRSDLSGALRGIRDRYRERRLAGIVIVSDGGDTGAQDAAAAADAGVPVYTIGIGSPDGRSDREVLDASAGEASLTGSSVDLTVSAVSHGSTAPFDIRLLENGHPIDLRQVTPSTSQSPVQAVFTVSPPRESPTVYTVEIPPGPGEAVLENNQQRILVEPPGRQRRVLMVEGAPAFEHAFIRRALTGDPALDIDSVVRKGHDVQGDATFFVQAATDRGPRLASGFPKDRESLDEYDAVILANVEPDAMARADMESLASFVGNRGGGLLVLGARSFAQQGFVGTSIEPLLPLGLASGGLVLTAAKSSGVLPVRITPDGESHPIMRLGATAEDTMKRWRAVPGLFGVSPLGAARPGARVLAVVQTPQGIEPLVAVQRYGQGRTMVFAGEASWRWRMQMPSTDDTYERFWRQAVRWLSKDSPDPVSIALPEALSTGDTGTLQVEVRNRAFEPLTDAQVSVRVTAPGGETSETHPVLADARAGRYASETRFAVPGVYRVTADARRGETVIGTATRWMLVGGTDREMADPRLNEDVLRRVSRASGGAYLAATEASRLSSRLSPLDEAPAAPRLQDLWHSAWVFAIVVALLGAEWWLRRRWGLR